MPADAQQPGADGPASLGTVSGAVVDAATGDPLPGAVVVLDAVGESAWIVAAPSSGQWSRGARTATGASGRYRFTGVSLGRYRLLVRRLGYRPAAVEIELHRAGGLQLSVGLDVVPIRLEPLEVDASLDSFGRTSGAPEAEAADRLGAEALRQERYLTSDARIITHHEVVEAVTLGETDLFRALLRLPGVATRDDFTAELWTRGAPWGLTRVYFDGLPLFNPLHTAGAFSAVNPDAVGGVAFLPGVHPADMQEGAAAIVDITSRRAESEEWHGLVGLSVVSARAAADRRFAAGRGGLMLAARRSYYDLVTRVAEAFGADSGTYVPYAFHDLTGRLEVPLGGAALLEVSGLWEEDRVWGTVRDLLRDSKGHWGNRLVGASLSVPVGGLATRHRLGVSRFLGKVETVPTGVYGADSGVVHGGLHNGLTYWTLGSEIAPGYAGQEAAWRAGVQLVAQHSTYDGPYPRPYPSAQALDSLHMHESNVRVALWGDVRWKPTAFLALYGGLRSELGTPLANAGALTLSPRITARYTLAGGRMALSAGYARSHQYAQPVAPAGAGIGPNLHATEVWLLAGDSVPAIEADVLTGGAELWLGRGWMAAVNLYDRRATGLAVPDPAPGIYTSTRPVFVPGTNRGRGVEVSARKLLGWWTGSVAYSYGHSELMAKGMRYPSAAERRHVLSATALAPVGRHFRLGAALALGSGAPYTRFTQSIVACDSVSPCPPTSQDTLQIEAPNAARAPPYAKLDLLVEWRRVTPSWELGVYLQLRNVFNRTNAVTYTGSVRDCPAGGVPPTLVPARPGLCDRFDRGLPFLPLLGAYVAF